MRNAAGMLGIIGGLIFGYPYLGFRHPLILLLVPCKG
mgnify:CR=1 FL=1